MGGRVCQTSVPVLCVRFVFHNVSASFCPVVVRRWLAITRTVVYGVEPCLRHVAYPSRRDRVFDRDRGRRPRLDVACLGLARREVRGPGGDLGPACVRGWLGPGACSETDGSDERAADDEVGPACTAVLTTAGRGRDRDKQVRREVITENPGRLGVCGCVGVGGGLRRGCASRGRMVCGATPLPTPPQPRSLGPHYGGPEACSASGRIFQSILRLMTSQSL